ncbi:hypothetical protein [Nonomuraea solani]|nr:hypothetical protein [Nonomuraea solani]
MSTSRSTSASATVRSVARASTSMVPSVTVMAPAFSTHQVPT